MLGQEEGRLMEDRSHGNDEKILDLLKMNYQNLHDSCWECHKAYWTITSIFLPVSFASLGLLLKQVPGQSVTVALIALVITLAFVTFWFLSSLYLNSWNDKRRKRLIAIENEFNRLGVARKLENNRPVFEHYTLGYSKGFKWLTVAMYVLLTAAAIGVVATGLVAQQSVGGTTSEPTPSAVSEASQR